jgi:GAF domain-containing protein
MRRRQKTAKPKVESKPPVARRSPKDDGERVRDLEKRLAESPERERAKDRALAEALEQQTATSEILQVISSSPTDVQPVFDAIVRNGMHLTGAARCVLFGFDGEMLSVLAMHNVRAEGIEMIHRIFPRPASRQSAMGRAVLDRTIAHIPDVTLDPEFGFPEAARAVDFRAVLAVPTIREGAPIGAIVVQRAGPGAFSESQIQLLKTFADQAVIAIENVRLFKELEARNRDVTEALDQKTATSEILRVIASSPTNIQPVFDTIVKSVARLCDGMFATLHRFDGELLHWVAQHNYTAEGLEAMREAYPMRADRDTASGRAVIDRTVIHVRDFEGDPDVPPRSRTIARAFGYRSLVTVPMLREGQPVGAIAVARRDSPFSAGQITLLQTFADQAVIAIENVRLFNETKEALERQTATSEILSVISRSPSDVQPVLDAVAENAARLCGADDAVIQRVDGGKLTVVAHFGGMPTPPEHASMPITREMAVGSAVLDRQTLHVHDMAEELRRGNYPGSRPFVERLSYRTMLYVPLVQGDAAVGVIVMRRGNVQPFTDQQIALVQTFADQAVIAIENVRLFNETKEALERQTATSEILRVISSSPTDVQPVFDAIAEAAARLCEAFDAAIFHLEGERLRLVAHHGSIPTVGPVGRFTIPLVRGIAIGRSVLDGRSIHVADIETDAEEFPGNEQLRRMGVRTILSVPLMREGVAIGAIGLRRTEVRPFTDQQISLLQTFADQALIAIENVRLFTELQSRTADLTRSVNQLSALGEVGQAVSSSLDLETVLTTIVSRAVQLSGVDGGVIFEYDEAAQEFTQRAATDPASALTEARRTTRIGKGEGVVGRTAVTLAPVQVPDITVAGAYEGRLRETLIEAGVRALLAVPMLREGHLIGCLAVTRNTPGDFPSNMIELLRTFATQSSLAIQNARLFLEIADKSRQLETASQHKSEFLANMSHELRTPLNAVIGFSEVLGERMFGELNEKQEEYLKDIHASGQHLLSLINDILDLSKIEAGRMELELADFDLPTALDSALALVRERAGRRGIALHLSVDERLGQMRADERKVRQVVLNLLSNAIKFTPEGGRIEVGAVAKDGVVEVSVSDTGVGIAPEDQEAVFEEFRQVGTAAKKVEGTGLGLTLCRKFVELHGGRIWVKSQVGAGSTFTFTIPARRGE